MFDKKFKYSYLDNEYDLALRMDREWKTTKERVLIVLQTVPAVSLKYKDIAPNGFVKDTLTNCISYANKLAMKLQGKMPYCSFAVVNFNAYKHMHGSRDQRRSDELKFAERLTKLIAKLKPTKILFSGHEAASYILKEDAHTLALLRGRVYDYKGAQAVVTLDLDRLFAKKFEQANLLGFFSRHLAYLLIGKHPFSLRKLYPTVRYVDTRKKFDNFYARLLKAKQRVAYDTETKDLHNYNNAIYTYQFALDTEPNVGYVIPFDHPTSPFSTEDREYIKAKLDRFFSTSELELVTFYGMFDLRVTRATHGLPVINNPVYEITGGEHLLDENTDALKNVDGLNHGNLNATLCRYDCDFYLKASFSKEDRGSIGTVAVNDKDFLLYCAMDVVSILNIVPMQVKHAALYEIENKNYKNIFLRAQRYSLGPTVHQLSHLEEDGSRVNLDYLVSLSKKGSPLIEEIEKAGDQFKKYESVKKANSNLLKKAGIRSNSLFGTGEQWVFKPTKGEHRAELFFNVLNLEPVSETSTGNPAIDAKFIKHYKGDVKEVATYGAFQEVSKLLSTYVRGWIKTLRTNVDSVTDHRLRPSYGFFSVVTGRLNSRNPNLQQIPSRGRLSVIIRRMFEAPINRMFIRYDYSAHEIRGWANISGDSVLAESFKMGQRMRQQYIQKPTEELAKELATKGDVHIMNVKHFFGKWIVKTDPLRDAIKAVVFGTLYGKSARSLGEDVGKDEQYAQDLIDKMFGTFKQGARWLDRMKRNVVEKYFVYSPLGRKRHLYAALTGDRVAISKQLRRGVNAPIQGMSSELGVIASYLIIRSYYTHMEKLNKLLKLDAKRTKIGFNRIVHDANYFDVDYKAALVLAHIVQYEATYGIAKYTEEKFGFKMMVEPEIELEFGVRDDRSHAWDWSLPSLVGCIVKTVLDAEEFNLLEGKNAREAFQQVWSVYEDERFQKYLQKHFPLLNVKQLKVQMSSAVKDYLKSIEKEAFFKKHKSVVM